MSRPELRPNLIGTVLHAKNMFTSGRFLRNRSGLKWSVSIRIIVQSQQKRLLSCGDHSIVCGKGER